MKQSRLQWFRPSFRNLVLIFLFSIILEKQQPLFASIDKIAMVVGLSSDLYSGHIALDGKTVLSPALVVHSWRNDYYGYRSNIKFETHGRISRNQYTGDYKYELRSLKSDGTYSVSGDVFPIDVMRRRNYRCDRSAPAFEWVPAQKHIFNELEDFVVALYHASPPAKTGRNPPKAPYKFIARTDAVSLPNNCNPVDPLSVEVDCMVIMLKDWGTVYERFPLVDVEYAWPPSVWGERAFIYGDGSIK
jgi:hypothetical protein